MDNYKSTINPYTISPKHNTKNSIFIKLIIFIIFLNSLTLASTTHRQYDLYQPELSYTTIYQGKYDPNSEHLSYNHCASIEHFNGQFYVVWQANTSGVERAQGTNLWLKTSKDFKTWSQPQKFLCSSQTCTKPFSEPTTQVQPGLLNYKNKELWCFFLHQRFNELDGVYLSRLKPNGKWNNTCILPNPTNINGKKYTAYTSVNPYIFSSGRIVLPLTFISRQQVPVTQHGQKTKMPYRYNGVIYSDDEGKIWHTSNLVSHLSDFAAMWEPTICEQTDGKIRFFVRSLYHPTTNRPQLNLLLTCTGTGTKKGSPIVYNEDVQVSNIEAFGDRIQILKLTSNRFVFCHHDLLTYLPAFANRKNTALFFSRSGSDDFVAGPVISRDSNVTSYTQAIEHNGKIYAAYTTGIFRRKPHPNTVVFSIEAVCIDPAPAPDKFYIWPRDRIPAYSDKNAKYSRPRLQNEDNKSCIVFKDGSTAGVETDPVFFDKAYTLKAEFNFKIKQIQKRGNLVLCSFGDKIPVRIAIPSNRPETLYAYTSKGWLPVAYVQLNKWHTISMVFEHDKFKIQLDPSPKKTFKYPANDFSPRFYLGDGYEIDFTHQSNNGSKFLINLNSIKTKVTK